MKLKFEIKLEKYYDFVLFEKKTKERKKTEN